MFTSLVPLLVLADLKRAMKEKGEPGQPTFALTADASEAHRQVPVHPSDWIFLGCQIAKGSAVYVNTVRTFGITSASYCWNRVGAAIGRISQCVVGDSAATWHKLVADDNHLEGEQYRFCTDVVLHYLFHHGCTFVSGGETVTWVGFELLHRTRQPGISQGRADWFRRWTTEDPSSSSVHTSSFEEGVGQVMYVAWALKFERPFLGPLYKFMSLNPVPPYVSFFLRHLAEQIAQRRHHDCSVKLFADQLAPRVDAQAISTRTGI